jgi:threonine aldolase
MSGRIYDLRSDTVTRPSPEMRRAIYQAEVGDDVYGEDPSINRLQEMAAEKTGKEAALFLTSGSMGNLIPLILNCGRGNEFLIDSGGHIINYEMASYSAVAGCVPVPMSTPRGILSAALLETKLKPDIYYMTKPRLVVIENTHNRAGGTCYPLGALEEISSFAQAYALKVHLDGARLFNASIATGIPPQEISRHADTVTFCFSKGLGAPVGAVLCSTAEAIAEARRVRKMLGGGMRQAGILAAAGIYSLEHNIDRLAEDHEHAKKLATALAETKWAVVDPAGVETNIVYFETPTEDAGQVSRKLREAGILANPTGRNRIRMVTHLDVSPQDMTEICRILERLDV